MKRHASEGRSPSALHFASLGQPQEENRVLSKPEPLFMGIVRGGEQDAKRGTGSPFKKGLLNLGEAAPRSPQPVAARGGLAAWSTVRLKP